MKPIIAITCDYEYTSENIKLHQDYYRAISQFGGLPILLPGNNIVDVEDILKLADGVLITGGADIDPSFYGESPHIELGNINPYRDEFEIVLAQLAVDRGIPILGICRGAQVMNVAMGGTLYQDINSQFERNTIAHRQKAPSWHEFHDIIIEEDSLLFNIVGERSIRVNSFHHQAAREIGPGLEIIARAPDGIVEAIAKPDHPFALGLQWHPEKMLDSQMHSQDIFNAFIDSTK